MNFDNQRPVEAIDFDWKALDEGTGYQGLESLLLDNKIETLSLFLRVIIHDRHLCRKDSDAMLREMSFRILLVAFLINHHAVVDRFGSIRELSRHFGKSRGTVGRLVARMRKRLALPYKQAGNRR